MGRRRHRQAERLGHLPCAAEYCTATERRCVVNAIHARADHVSSRVSYFDARRGQLSALLVEQI